VDKECLPTRRRTFGRRAKGGASSHPLRLPPVLLAILVVGLLLAISCGGQPREREIDLRARPQATQPPTAKAPSRDRFVLAVAAVNSPMSTLKTYEDLANYLGSRLGMEARFVGGKTYAEINSLVRSGDATMAIVCSGAYIYGNNEFGMELLAAPVVNGQLSYYSNLIVRKDSSITNWQQLQGRTFAFTDPLSNSGRLVPLYQIRIMGKTPESFFSSYIFTYSHDNSIKAVARGLVDAAAVDSLVYEYALAQKEDEASATRIIWRSPPYAINPVVVNPTLDTAFKSRLRDLLLEMDASADGREVLARLRFDRFVPVSDSAYASIRDMARTVGIFSAP
jgi:phosphonate transport system substrate-binding protein